MPCLHREAGQACRATFNLNSTSNNILPQPWHAPPAWRWEHGTRHQKFYQHLIQTTTQSQMTNQLLNIIKPEKTTCITSEKSLIDLLLEEQQQLTAIDSFAQQHRSNNLPKQAKYYSSLMPASPPKAGEQYAFEVDLDRCSGCKACVTACHSLNGLDEYETWRSVGLLTGGTTTHPAMQHVTMACHHCIDAPCMKGCPVDAYEKDPVTGIVKHLDDQCFGCQYCTLACPYDVPQYNASKGIVRKCDMCSDRLVVGEAPACVQSCPTEAIAIRIVKIDKVIEDAEANVFLPAAPEPYISYPTTTYKTKQVFPRNMLPADYYSVAPQHPHLPLIIMLVLTQLSVGAFTIGLIVEQFLSADVISIMRPIHATSALLFGLLALGASTLHLGRPQYAFRAIIGFRHSWLSREIVAFGLFAGLAVLYAISTWLSVGLFSDFTKQYPQLLLWTDALGWGVAIPGGIGLFCSAMVYVFTKKTYWNFVSTAIKFLFTSIILGIACFWSTLMIVNFSGESSLAEPLLKTVAPVLCQSMMLASAIKLLFEASIFGKLLGRQNSPLKRSARLMIGPLSNFTLARFACGLLGGIVMPMIILLQLEKTLEGNQHWILGLMVAVLFIASLCGEMLERYLFFAAVASPRMPGSIRS